MEHDQCTLIVTPVWWDYISSRHRCWLKASKAKKISRDSTKLITQWTRLFFRASTFKIASYTALCKGFNNLLHWEDVPGRQIKVLRPITASTTSKTYWYFLFSVSRLASLIKLNICFFLSFFFFFLFSLGTEKKKSTLNVFYYSLISYNREVK